LAGRFDSTIHSTSFSCNVNWGVKNAKDSSWGIQRKETLENFRLQFSQLSRKMIM
jgi:hypothetical protein